MNRIRFIFRRQILVETKKAIVSRCIVCPDPPSEAPVLSFPKWDPLRCVSANQTVLS